MPGGKGGDYDVQLAPLKSELQLEFLDQYIRGIQGQMQDFPLGVPYGGPGVSSYKPRVFELEGGYSGEGRKGPGPTIGPGPAAQTKSKGPGPPAAIVANRGTKAKPGPGPKGRPKARAARSTEAPVNVADFLSGEYGMGYTTPFYASDVPQALTSAYTNPWYNLLSGNFPRAR